ncbi:hypothetical protein [Algibacter sp. PT7-4]|uniref:hypothetical protein n=1 Tax=Algibacter ulvanivorans TaxID=3400999 RepID=UPI003AAE0026
MKNYFLLLFVGITFLNCSNNDDNSQELQLIGTWNWVESSGGIDGRTETPTSTGNSMKIEISSNSVKRYLNGNLESELTYSTEFEEYNGEQWLKIIYENEWEQHVDLNTDYLILYDRCSDCFQYEYVRE